MLYDYVTLHAKMLCCCLKENLQFTDLARYVTDIALSMICICRSFTLISTIHNKIFSYNITEYNNFVSSLNMWNAERHDENTINIYP
jgi:hypothetical protein